MPGFLFNLYMLRFYCNTFPGYHIKIHGNINFRKFFLFYFLLKQYPICFPDLNKLVRSIVIIACIMR